MEEAIAVLKITWLSRKGRVATLKLEGELLRPWVETVRDACIKWPHRTKRLRLDLTAVTFADAAGVQLLRDLMAEGVEVASCSSFVAELLRLKP
jgi:ABC-type transporter Mla MlaB component